MHALRFVGTLIPLRVGFRSFQPKLRRRLWKKYILVFLCLIFCFSIWKMTTKHPFERNYHANSIHYTYSYPIEHLPASDYTTLMNITNFKFNILNKCKFSSLLLLILIHTSPMNFQRRKSIRETWGSKLNRTIKLVFMMGSVKNRRLQMKLEAENEKFNDFVQGSFTDAYKNMTYKHVMALKYTIYHCPQAKYILKIDDDVFVNIPYMMNFLTNQLSPYGATNLLMCSVKYHTKVYRWPNHRWGVSFAEFKDEYYPPYCPGWTLLYSPDVVFTLYRAVQKADYFWIDDVLITGIMAKKEMIRHTNIKFLILTQKSMIEIGRHDGFYNNTKQFLFGPYDMSNGDMYILWDFIKNQSNRDAIPKDYM